MDLRDHLKDVIADPSPAEPELEAEDIEGSPEDKKTERTPDNVRRELLRKQEKLERTVLDRLDRIDQRFSEYITGTKPVEAPKAKTDLSQYSYAELEQLEKSVDWEKISDNEKAAFQSLKTAKRIDEALDQRFSQFSTASKFADERKRYAQMATSRYPQLVDYNSDFARKVNSRLSEQSKAWIDSNPRALFDIANEVASEMDLKPQRRKVVSGKVAGSDSAPVDTEPSYVSPITDEEEKFLAEQLQYALPKGGKFDIEQIKKKRAELAKRKYPLKKLFEGTDM